MATAARVDEQIQQDVIAELQGDLRIHPNEIGVTVAEGVVTLTGVVDSYIKRWSVEEAVVRVLGVKAVANGVEVRLPGSSERPDAEIAEAAASALQWDAFVSPERIHVTVTGGWLTLRGEVSYAFQREDAARVVRRLNGVRGVTNLVTVRARNATARGLRRKIEQALVRNAAVDARGIEVELVGPKVILRGTVRAWAEKQEAERVAWSMPGVTAVEDHITIGP